MSAESSHTKASGRPLHIHSCALLASTGAWRKKAFVRASGWDGPFAASLEAARNDPGWAAYEIDSGHDIPIDRPTELAAILEACA